MFKPKFWYARNIRYSDYYLQFDIHKSFFFQISIMHHVLLSSISVLVKIYFLYFGKSYSVGGMK